MKTIGVCEARTHFSKLLEEVTRGSRVTITKHGIPIAVLQPIERLREEPETVVERIKSFRGGNILRGVSIKSLIKEGRR